MCGSTVIPDPVQGLGSDHVLLGRTALCKLRREKNRVTLLQIFLDLASLKIHSFFKLNIHIVLE
jgi:hypothetical protein